MWRGHPLAADARKLPTASSSQTDFVVETTLDYGCEWNSLVARNLVAPHLSLRNDGPFPALGVAGKGSSVSVELDTLVVVRHRGGAGGTLGDFSEDMHVVPIAAQRSRVLLRHRFPGTPLLSLLMRLPGFAAFLTIIVQNWNYRLAFDTLASASPTGAAAERVARFSKVVERGQQTDGQYFAQWDPVGQRTQTDEFGQQQTDEAFGTYGLRRNYVLDTPLAQYAPLQTSEYRGMLDRYKAVEQSIFAAILTAPAGLLTYKTVAPAVAVVLGSHGS